MLRKFFADEFGATAIEYSLIAAGIAVAVLLAAIVLGDTLSNFFNTIANTFNSYDVGE